MTSPFYVTISKENLANGQISLHILNSYSFGRICWKFYVKLLLFDASYEGKKKGAFLSEHCVLAVLLRLKLKGYATLYK